MEPNRVRKSLSNEETFLENLESLPACRNALDRLIADLQDELRRKAADRTIRKVFVKVKFDDFTRITRECICAEPSRDVFQSLLATAYASCERPVRLLGAGVRFEETDDAEESPQQWLDL